MTPARTGYPGPAFRVGPRAGLDDRRGDPEYRYTRNDVLAAKASVEQGFRSGAAAEAPADPRPALLAPIMVTIGSVGSSVMPHFLHSPWQWVLFLVLVLVGVAGLALTWISGARAKRVGRATARTQAASARLDG